MGSNSEQLKLQGSAVTSLIRTTATSLHCVYNSHMQTYRIVSELQEELQRRDTRLEQKTAPRLQEYVGERYGVGLAVGRVGGLPGDGGTAEIGASPLHDEDGGGGLVLAQGEGGRGEGEDSQRIVAGWDRDVEGALQSPK